MSSARTDFNSVDPTLRPPKFQRRKADMFRSIVELIEDQENFSIVSKDEAAARLSATCKGGLLGAVHDVEIWVEGDAGGPVSVHARSARRSGFELGLAKRIVRDFTRRLHHREA